MCYKHSSSGIALQYPHKCCSSVRQLLHHQSKVTHSLPSHFQKVGAVLKDGDYHLTIFQFPVLRFQIQNLKNHFSQNCKHNNWPCMPTVILSSQEHKHTVIKPKGIQLTFVGYFRELVPETLSILTVQTHSKLLVAH